MASSRVDEILDSPHYFLSRIDSDNERLELVHTARETLSSAPFIDGRTPLSSSKSISVSFEDAFSWQSKINSAASNFIFHTAFCGSTLMARTLDVENKCLSYKEPQVLIDLCQLKSSKHKIYEDQARWDCLLSVILKKLNVSPNSAERTIIKPSNWVNTISKELMLAHSNQKAILLSINPKDYLVAIFRGGDKRWQYMHSFLQHFTKDKPRIRKVVHSLENANENVVDLRMKLSLIAYMAQTEEFNRLSELVPAHNTVNIEYADLVEQPVATVASASTLFNLGLSTKDIKLSVERTYQHHAKTVGEKFNDQSWRFLDKLVRNKYKAQLNRSLEWYLDTRYVFEHQGGALGDSS